MLLKRLDVCDLGVVSGPRGRFVLSLATVETSRARFSSAFRFVVLLVAGCRGPLDLLGITACPASCEGLSLGVGPPVAVNAFCFCFFASDVSLWLSLGACLLSPMTLSTGSSPAAKIACFFRCQNCLKKSMSRPGWLLLYISMPISSCLSR